MFFDSLSIGSVVSIEKLCYSFGSCRGSMISNSVR